MTSLFLAREQALEMGLTASSVDELEVVGMYYPTGYVKGSQRSQGEPLYRTSDVERIINAERECSEVAAASDGRPTAAA